MRHTLSVVAVGAMLVGFAGCGDDGFTQADWDDVFDSCVPTGAPNCGLIANQAEAFVNDGGFDKTCVVRLAKSAAGVGRLGFADIVRLECLTIEGSDDEPLWSRRVFGYTVRSILIYATVAGVAFAAAEAIRAVVRKGGTR